MKASKALGLLITVVELAGVAAFALGMHTMIGVYISAMPSEDQVIEPTMGDPVVIPFTLHPRNGGFMEATLTVSISVVAEEDQVLATDSATVTIPAGDTAPVELELRIPAGVFQQHMDDPDLSWVTDIEVATLFDLISFGNTVTAPGGG